MVGCYNCGDLTHISAHCQKMQRFSRCPNCNIVCFQANKHKVGCTNADFISTPLHSRPSIVEMAKLVEIMFSPQVNDVVIYNEGTEMPIRNQPLFINFSCIQVRREGRSAIIYTGKNDEKVICIIDKHGKNRLKLFVGAKVVINNYYNLSSEGVLSYNLHEQQSTTGRSDCCLKIYADAASFKTCIKWFEFSLIVHCLPDGVLLQQPMEKRLTPKQISVGLGVNGI